MDSIEKLKNNFRTTSEDDVLPHNAFATSKYKRFFDENVYNPNSNTSNQDNYQSSKQNPNIFNNHSPYSNAFSMPQITYLATSQSQSKLENSYMNNITNLTNNNHINQIKQKNLNPINNNNSKYQE